MYFNLIDVPAYYTPWFAGEPNNWNGNERNLALLRDGRGVWGLLDSNERLNMKSICEKSSYDYETASPAVSLVYPTSTVTEDNSGVAEGMDKLFQPLQRGDRL